MSLPAHWVDRIFEKLTLIYGREFLDRWKGIPLEDVKADWGKELSAFAAHPDLIAYGLEHMPSERPPTVLQFRDICRRSPPKVLPQIAVATTPMPPEIREKLNALTKQMKMKA